MAGKEGWGQIKLLWSLVYLVGLIGTHFMVAQGQLAETTALWIWLIVLMVSGYHMGMSGGIKWPAEVESTWMYSMVLFVVLVGAMLLNWWSGDAAVFFALYFIIFGAANFATGHAMKKESWVFMGLMSLAFGLVFPAWFNSVPFFAAGLILGVPMLLSSMKK